MLSISYVWVPPLVCLDTFGWEHEGNNKSVQTQHFSEDKDKDHANKQPGLLRSAADTSIAHDADGKTSGQTTEPHREASTKVKEGSAVRKKVKMKDTPKKSQYYV